MVNKSINNQSIKNNIILLSIGILICFNSILISSEITSPRFYIEKDSNFTLQEVCRYNGIACDASYNCSLSILLPNQNKILSNALMFRNDSFYQYNLTEQYSNVNGFYEYVVDCTNSTFGGYSINYYQVTPNGSKPITQSQSIILIIVLTIMVIFALYLGYLGLKAVKDVPKLILILFSILLLVFSLGVGVNIVEESFGTFQGINDNFSTVYVLFTILLSAGVIALILYLIIVATRVYRTKRGLFVDDNYD